jgi:hypothetical protein
MVATSLIVWPPAPVFLLMHRKDVNIPKGTEVTAYISGDVKLDPAKVEPAPLAAAAPPVPTTQQVPTSSPAATPNAGPNRHYSCIAGRRGGGGIGSVVDSRWRRHRD